jgi:TonB family protein
MSEAWKQWEGHVLDGRYTLGAFQGATDHSAVFLTTHGKLSEKAAIKFIEYPRQGGPAQLARWERASKLSHRHLIRLLDWGQCRLADASMLYVVTESADENLGQILPTRPLTASETEYMLRSMLEVLSYLHAAGLVHGRLRPSNLMAVGDNLKLSSDTVCSAGDKNITAREPSVYDAPEVAASGFSPAGDVWSLGITLVEAFTQRPAPGEAIRQADPKLPETIPAPFLEIARQCLRLDPERRWTVADIAAHLLPAPVVRRKSRNGSRPVQAAVAVLVLGGILAGAKFLRQGSETTDQPSSPPSSPASSAPSPAPSANTSPVEPVQPPPSPQPAAPAVSSHAPEKPATDDAAPPPPAPKSPAREGFLPGSVEDRVVPAVSQKSRNTINGKVRVSVRVAVDTSGRVVDAKLASPGPSRYFANIALEASRRWKFTPPQARGEAVPSEWMLRYAFRRNGVDVSPAQLSPSARGN